MAENQSIKPMENSASDAPGGDQGRECGSLIASRSSPGQSNGESPEAKVDATSAVTETKEDPVHQPQTSTLPSLRRPSRSRQTQARLTGANRLSNASASSDRSGQLSDGTKSTEHKRPTLGTLGICALDAKARSKPSRNILNRINAKQEFEVIIFGDKVILDEAPENWPLCDYLISFFSDGFPLDKAIEYARLRKPFTVNDLPMQRVLWDRRVCLRILDKWEVPTPDRLEVNRDGGPRLVSKEMARHLFERTGVYVLGPSDGTGGGEPAPSTVKMLDDDTLSVEGKLLKKPFVEKPVSGEDHNIRIYYSSDVGGGGRRLFRKINNKSSESDSSLSIPRSITEEGSSYIYEKFLSTQNHEDVKAYTVGHKFCHAETRKSPVVDGIVKRNTHGKEMRYITALTPEEVTIASKISNAFGQRICGFDMLRVRNKSFVIDVNGWSFVKDNTDYYDKCAEILKGIFVEERQKREAKPVSLDGEGLSTSSSPTRASFGHFDKVKNMLKSPSMSRLASNSLPGTRSQGRSSPDPLSLGSAALGTTRQRGDSDALRSPISSGANTEPATSPALPTVGSEGAISDPGTAQEQQNPVPLPASKSQWRLKGMVAVIRHADRTPKQKWKFTFHTKPFVDLLKGHREEVLLVGEAALNSVMEATEQAMQEGGEDPEKLKLLRTSLAKKGAWLGTKVQIKPMFSKKKSSNKDKAPKLVNPGDDAATGLRHSTATSKAVREISNGHSRNPSRQGSVSGITLSREAAAQDNLDIEKLQLIVKWGGEPTHSARYQSHELGESMRNDLLLMNRDAIDDLVVYSSSERRSTTSAQLWTAAFLDQKDVAQEDILIRKDLLDDSNAAKDETDKVKKKLKDLLRKGDKAPPQFAWPGNMPEPYIVARNLVELMKFHRMVMRDNFQSLYGGSSSSFATAMSNTHASTVLGSPSGLTPVPGAMSQVHSIHNVQSRWCCGEDPDLFKERWEKLFDEFCDPEKVDPSKISELHDTMKFDALHNRQFLEWVFTPSPQVLESFSFSDVQGVQVPEDAPGTRQPMRSDTGTSTLKYSTSPPEEAPNKPSDKPAERSSFAHFMGLKRREPAPLAKTISDAAMESYFNLFAGSPKSKCKTDVRLERLRELFLYSKVLFDFIGPQEYGILDSEKLEIGLLTSLPLLRAIVNNLEDMQASEGAKTTAYFTKESHIYTLLNCIIEGGVQTKIERNKIPELDYLSTICFELYESPNEHPADETVDESKEDFNYSIRITISPGCHTFEPLDVQLDSRHTIGFAQRRSLTAHNDWKMVIETLRAKFHTVKLPQSFIAVNLSEKVPQAFGGAGDHKGGLGESGEAASLGLLDSKEVIAGS